MPDLLIPAIPCFVLLMVVEYLSYRHATEAALHGMKGYDAKDTASSLAVGFGSIVVDGAWRVVPLFVYSWLYQVTPLRMPSDAWWTYVLLFLADDFAYYWYHRICHTVRLFWASHIIHHSSQHYNYSTAVRQSWFPMTTLPFWAPLAIAGFAPWMIFTIQSVSLIYQFWIHTERIRTLPRFIEALFNTPSHHRVHHGSNRAYLDRNFGGVLIVWDRMFGTFRAETEAVVYGLTENIATHNPLKIACNEYLALCRDIGRANSWRERWGYLFGGPGWSPPRGSARDD